MKDRGFSHAGFGGTIKSPPKKSRINTEAVRRTNPKSKAAIGSYEQGVQIPPTDVLISLAKLYHLSLDDLVGLNEPQPNDSTALSSQQQDLINDLMTILNADNMSAEELRQAQLKFIGNLTRMFQE